MSARCSRLLYPTNQTRNVENWNGKPIPHFLSITNPAHTRMVCSLVLNAGSKKKTKERKEKEKSGGGWFGGGHKKEAPVTAPEGSGAGHKAEAKLP